MKVNKKVFTYTSPDATRDKRFIAALGKAELDPSDLLTAVFILSHNKDAEIKEAAKKTLSEFPRETLLTALNSKLDPAILGKIAGLYDTDEEALIRIALNYDTDTETIKQIANGASCSLLDKIVKASEKITGDPAILEAIKKNTEINKKNEEENSGEPEVETLEQAPEEEATVEETDPEIAKKLVMEARDYDEDDDGEMEEENLNITQIISRMGVSEKIKFAQTGNKEVRNMLIKSANKMISSAVLKNARITEDEVIKLSASKTASDEIIRLIARNREWMKLAIVKSNLVSNPKTPIAISLRLVRFLTSKNLTSLSKSKSISNVLRNEAAKALDLKKKH